MAEKLVLDTDIGSDIDDAVCLAYLLAQPACDLLGITTVSGEGEARARMASALCKVAGREVPIFPGAELPLLGPSLQPHAPQAAALDRWPHDRDFPRGEAIEFLRTTIRAHPGEVTLLAIGPLTNVALLFRVDPEIPALLKRLVLMGGVFTGAQPSPLPVNIEWNIKNDPDAAAVVYASRPPVHRSLGLDVTRQVVMAATEVRARFDTPLLRPVRDFAEVWFRQRESITFHDPLAATVIFDESLCTFSRGNVDVELTSTRARGVTYFTADANGPLEVGATVDVAAFFAHYFSVFAA